MKIEQLNIPINEHEQRHIHKIHYEHGIFTISTNNITFNQDEWYLETQDKRGDTLYYQNQYKYWEKVFHDENGQIIYILDSSNYWERRLYDARGNEIYFHDSKGYWCENTYDEWGNCIKRFSSYEFNKKLNK